MKFTFTLIVLAAVIVFGMSRVFSASNPGGERTNGSQTLNPTITKPADEAATGGNLVFFPMTNYRDRITNRKHGQLITPKDTQGLPCGTIFEGYHLGDDLEVTSAEVQAEVLVYAVADGVVRKKELVNGYGGLLVIEHTLDGQSFTANYGHIRMENNSLQVNDHVLAGQKIAVLGSGCSDDTDNERKHLHFAIRKGTTIGVKGYTDSQNELNEQWVNPTDFLETRKAILP